MNVHLIDPYTFRKILIIKGYSQRKLAREINLSHPYLNQIINGERNPSGEVAKRIVDKLELNFEDIFFINDDNNCKQDKGNPNAEIFNRNIK